MADVTWTREQLAAITARNPGILVSAGAGSGKTAVLTERVVQRIFDPADPVDADRMLIVTFTRAAAEEMRERIAVKLRAVQREHPEDSTVARQLILLEKADISTVHAFCQRIVKENFQLLDIQSGFRIADEKELEVWRTEAAGEILEEEYAAGEESFLSLVELLSEERSDRRVTDTLLRLYDFIRAHPFYDAWLDQALERYRSEAPIGETDWGRLLIADGLSGARQALEAMEEARDLLDGDEKIQKAYGSYIATLYAAAKGVLDSLTAGDWDGAYQAVQHIDGRFSGLRGYEDEWKKARVTALRDQAKALLEELREQKINDGGAGNRNVLPFEVGQSLRFGLGGDDEPETAVVRRGVRGRRHNSLRRAAFILHEDVDDVPEMPAQRPRPHGGTELQRALEGDKFHFQPLFGEQAFVCRDVQDDGVGGGEDAKLERGAVRGLDGGKDEQGKED